MDIFSVLNFERLICPMVLPKRKGAIDELYYGQSVRIESGGELYVRSAEGPFNLLPKKAVKHGVRKVFAIGPGIAEGTEFESLVHAQWFDPPDRATDEVRGNFPDAILTCSVNELFGKRNLILSFVCGG